MDNCNAQCRDFFNRPLGGFAAMGLYLGILQVGVSLYSLIRYQELADCQFPDGFPSKVGLINWSWIQTGLGATDMLFPLYIHLMLYRNLITEARIPDNLQKGPSERTLEARTEDGPIRVSRHDIYEAFKTTFVKDPIAYAYMLLIVASLVWAILGWVWIDEGGDACNPDKIWPLAGCWLSLFFVGFIALYGGTWLYQLQAYEKTDILTLRSGGNDKDMGWQQAPPPPAVHDNEQTGLMSWFGNNNNQQGVAAQAPPKPKPKPKSKIRQGIKLFFCLFLDMLGNATYFFPVAEVGDAVFAPASAVMLKMLYNSNGIAAIGCTEEILPFTDITPTATIAWFMENVMGNNCCTRAFGFAHKDE